MTEFYLLTALVCAITYIIVLLDKLDKYKPKRDKKSGKFIKRKK